MNEKISIAVSAVTFMRYIFSAVALFALSVSGSTDRSGSVGSHANAERLKTGRFLYRTVLDGKDAGTSEISISKSGADSFLFTNQVRGAFAQQWEAVATALFVPVSVKLGSGEGDKLQPRFELIYRDGRAAGWRLEKSTNKKIDIDAEVSSDTVDQRIDWACAMSQELAPGHEFTFSVFDPLTQISHVTARVTGPETVNVPAGTFTAFRITYSIKKSDRTETYQVLTNTEGARMLLKEEFPDSAITELVRLSE